MTVSSQKGAKNEQEGTHKKKKKSKVILQCCCMLHDDVTLMMYQCHDDVIEGREAQFTGPKEGGATLQKDTLKKRGQINQPITAAPQESCDSCGHVQDLKT